MAETVLSAGCLDGHRCARRRWINAVGGHHTPHLTLVHRWFDVLFSADAVVVRLWETPAVAQISVTDGPSARGVGAALDVLLFPRSPSSVRRRVAWLADLRLRAEMSLENVTWAAMAREPQNLLNENDEV